MKCGTCIHFDPINQAILGLCRFNPPAPSWPRVHPDLDRCGKHTPPIESWSKVPIGDYDHGSRWVSDHERKTGKQP